jgi:acyl-CoA synthetase (AMP-forming)/AMP-acid ligase II
LWEKKAVQSPDAAPFGLMQDWPLTVDKFLEHARRFHAQRGIVSRLSDGRVTRTTYGQLHLDAKRISAALLARGVRRGDRVATLAMNGADHMATWYAIAGIGAVCHTLNPRLFADDLAYIVDHAQDRLIFADGALASLAYDAAARCPSVERIVLYDHPDSLPAGVRCERYEDLLGEAHPEPEWGGFDERTAAGLCYTSGTTGNPKGVLYSHRSNYLQALMSLQGDAFGITTRECVLPVVPMFHANAWGLTFSAPAVGAKLVLPGPRLDGQSLFDLMEQERVTLALGVPTVWLGFMNYLQANGLRPSTLTRVISGGAACPERLMRDFHALGIELIPAWGMTELSPVGTLPTLTPELIDLPFEEQLPYRIKQGRAPCGVEMKLTDAEGAALPHDGETMGHLKVRGPSVASAYYRREDDVLDAEGFFDTGDIATIDSLGFMQITDRAKDIVKSGGEWISSQGVEEAAMSHAAVAQAGVIGVPHDSWGERPVLFVALRDPLPDAEAALSDFLVGRLAKWWLPDRIFVLDAMPLGATGKVDKKVLRRIYAEELATQ